MKYVKQAHSTDFGTYEMTVTDHSEEIATVRSAVDRAQAAFDAMNAGTRNQIGFPEYRHAVLAACALLECHDATGISLDNWTPVRDFVESTLGFEILENHV